MAIVGSRTRTQYKPKRGRSINALAKLSHGQTRAWTSQRNIIQPKGQQRAYVADMSALTRRWSAQPCAVKNTVFFVKTMSEQWTNTKIFPEFQNEYTKWKLMLPGTRIQYQLILIHHNKFKSSKNIWMHKTSIKHISVISTPNHTKFSSD
jgi:hypothetical protein